MEDCVCMVTGGASGLGLAVVQRVAAKGGRAVVADLPTSKGEAIAEALGERVVFVATDVTSEEEVKKLCAECKETFGRLDLVVNCAGVIVQTPDTMLYDPEQRVLHDLDQFRRVLEVNTTGTYNVMRHAAATMHDNDPDEHGQRGVIVNAASIAAYDGMKGLSAYAASKGAVVALTLPVARELSTIGVRVCAIAPGLFDTPMLAGVPPIVMDHLAKNIPFPSKLGSSEWFALTVESILINPYLNGEVIRLDGALRLPH